MLHTVVFSDGLLLIIYNSKVAWKSSLSKEIHENPTYRSSTLSATHSMFYFGSKQ